MQAGSDKVLKLMNRGYSKAEYLKIIEKIKAKVPECSVTTDIMVGFPGETEQDFQETLDVVNEARFDQAFMFIYSPREGTAAFNMSDQVAEEVKKERFVRLVELQDKITYEVNKKLVGRRFEVLAEGISKKDKQIFFGRTRSNKVVNFYAPDVLEGTLLDVKIVKALKKSLVGERS